MCISIVTILVGVAGFSDVRGFVARGDSSLDNLIGYLSSEEEVCPFVTCARMTSLLVARVTTLIWITSGIT